MTRPGPAPAGLEQESMVPRGDEAQRRSHPGLVDGAPAQDREARAGRTSVITTTQTGGGGGRARCRHQQLVFKRGALTTSLGACIVTSISGYGPRGKKNR